MSHLVPCPSCSRHVRVSETECPFCGDVVHLAGSPAPAVPTSRLGRAATFAFGATLIGATSMMACGGDGDDGDDGGTGGSISSGGSSGKSGTGGTAGAPNATGATGGSVAPAYGFPAVGGTDGGGGVSGGSNAGTAGSPQPLYGAAPAD